MINILMAPMKKVDMVNFSREKKSIRKIRSKCWK